MTKGLVTRASVFNRAAPGADTNILTTSITPTEDCAFLIEVVLATGSVFNYIVTDGTTTFTVGLNASAALNGGDGYTFTITAPRTESTSGDANALSYNFRVETNGIIQKLVVFEAQIGTTG